VVRQEADGRAERLRRIITELQSSGIKSANGLAKALNGRHVATVRGGTWTARSVLNVLERLGTDEHSAAAVVRDPGARGEFSGLWRKVPLRYF
jgi:hypothetical protein